MKFHFLLFLLVLFNLTFTQLRAQEKFSNWNKTLEDFKIEPFMMVQLWSSYTTDMEVYDEENATYLEADDRFNFLVRRARLGFRANPYKGIRFTFVGAYDLIGRDVLTGLIGGTNNDSKPTFGIWDAFMQWQVKPGNQSINVVAGYFRPQFSRESITSGWSVNSMEKSMSQNYIRRHLVGSGPGRAAGINIGGLILGDKIGLNYNVGVFNPVYHDNNGNSTGLQSAPLVASRLVFYLGDPEQKKYKIGYDINYYGERRGLSLGLAYAYQASTDLFDASEAIGLDLLFNWGPLNIDADWNFMARDGMFEAENISSRNIDYASNTGHIRLGYNIIIDDNIFLEPTFMMMQFNGGLSTEEQANAKALGAFSGEEKTYDAGINWYINKKRLKLMLHYTWRKGNAGAAGDAATVNQFFSQNSVGAIRRGNWLGLGLNAIF